MPMTFARQDLDFQWFSESGFPVRQVIWHDVLGCVVEQKKRLFQQHSFLGPSCPVRSQKQRSNIECIDVCFSRSITLIGAIQTKRNKLPCICILRLQLNHLWGPGQANHGHHLVIVLMTLVAALPGIPVHAKTFRRALAQHLFAVQHGTVW